MRLPFFGKRRESFISFIERTLKTLEKSPFKAVIVYDSQWLPLYAYKENELFEGELQEILKLKEEAGREFEKSLKEEISGLTRKSLKYRVSSLFFRYGKFSVAAVSRGELHLVAVVDELEGRVGWEKLEKMLTEKLEKIVEKVG